MPQPVDLVRFVQFSDGTASGLTTLVELFVANTTEALEDLAAAIGSGMPAEIERVAHRAAGSTAACGAGRLGELLSELERVAQQGGTERAADLLSEIAAEAARVCEFLRQTIRRESEPA
jgi:HPt (histidine-containing phosphotransfer) domain-containing protein